jgi:hypothetical protein
MPALQTGHYAVPLNTSIDEHYFEDRCLANLNINRAIVIDGKGA